MLILFYFFLPSYIFLPTLSLLSLLLPRLERVIWPSFWPGSRTLAMAPALLTFFYFHETLQFYLSLSSYSHQLSHFFSQYSTPNPFIRFLFLTPSNHLPSVLLLFIAQKPPHYFAYIGAHLLHFSPPPANFISNLQVHVQSISTVLRTLVYEEFFSSLHSFFDHLPL